MRTTITIERGIAFFEDGTEVGNVSVPLIKAAPAMLEALKAIHAELRFAVESTDELESTPTTRAIVGMAGVAIHEAEKEIEGCDAAVKKQ